MKRALIDMISNQNNQLNGGFIDQSVEDYVEKIYKNAHLQLYIIQGNLTGFIAYYCNDALQQLAFLSMLCVKPEYAKKGIGKHLLNCSIAYIKNKGFCNYGLQVKENNPAAIELYKTAGFEITGISAGTLSMNKSMKNEG
jgi:ribosomal protein S18 acetylase RimI-like enzyme